MSMLRIAKLYKKFNNIKAVDEVSFAVEAGEFFADDAPQPLNMGRFHVLRGQTDDAAATFENSYKLNPNQPGIKFFMAVARLSQNRRDDARKLLEDIDEADPFAASAKDLLQKLKPR